MKLTQSQFQSRIREIYHNALLCKSNNTELQEQLTKYIRKEINRVQPSGRRVYTMYDQGVVNMALRIYDDMFNANVEFCYLYNGELYSTHKVTNKRSIEELYTWLVDIDTLERGTVYKGSDKVFYGFKSAALPVAMPFNKQTGTFKD